MQYKCGIKARIDDPNLDMVSNDELEARRKKWSPPKLATERGYVKLYIDHVQQAHLGADLNILNGGSDGEVTRDLH